MSITAAIIGRPNVGKSTLFNRLAGRKIAIVHDMPGVTRDRKEADITFRDLSLKITDTASIVTIMAIMASRITETGRKFLIVMQKNTAVQDIQMPAGMISTIKIKTCHWLQTVSLF